MPAGECECQGICAASFRHFQNKPLRKIVCSDFIKKIRAFSNGGIQAIRSQVCIGVIGGSESQPNQRFIQVVYAGQVIDAILLSNLYNFGASPIYLVRPVRTVSAAVVRKAANKMNSSLWLYIILLI